MAESFTPPERVASAARRGLRLREKVKAGTDVGVARARDLSNRRAVSLETIGRMVSFFARHGAQKPANIGGDADPTPWLVAWLLWGGDAGRDWAESVWRRRGSEGEASRMGLARHGEWVQALARLAPEPDGGVDLRNPKGLHVGKPFRVLTAGGVFRDEATGELLDDPLTAEDIAEMARVFYVLDERGEGRPKLNSNHGPMRGKDARLHGEVLACYVADDGERGPGLYVVPGYTDAGHAFVAHHATPDGGSVLWNSPEFVRAPIYSRGGSGELLGAAQLLGVALTGDPVQAEPLIDAVCLSRTQTGAMPEEVSAMDPEVSAGEAGVMERIAAQDARLDEMDGKLSKLLSVVEGWNQGRDAEVAEVVAEASEAVADMVESEGEKLLEQALSMAEAEAPEEAMAEADAELSYDDRKALSRRGHPSRVVALARRVAALNAATRAHGSVSAKALSREVRALKAEALEAKCDAAMADLRQRFGLFPAEEAQFRAFWLDEQTAPKALSRPAGVKSAYAFAVEALAERAKAQDPRGMRGVKASAPVALSRDGIRAWAKDRGMDYDSNPAAVASAWSAATGHSFREVQQ